MGRLHYDSPKMNSIGLKVTSGSGLIKFILMVRKKVVCFKKGNQLFGDNGLQSLRDRKDDCNRAMV